MDYEHYLSLLNKLGFDVCVILHGLTEVEWVSTRASHRGRGIGAALTWVATTAAPAHAAVLVATDDGRPVYERLGYVALMRLSMWLKG
mgnify:CR=1 FL=1